MTENILDRLLNLHFRLNRGECHPDFEPSRREEYESKKAEIQGMIENRDCLPECKELHKYHESKIAELKEELRINNKCIEAFSKERNYHKNKSEQYKSTIDEIEKLVEKSKNVELGIRHDFQSAKEDGEGELELQYYREKIAIESTKQELFKSILANLKEDKDES